MKTIIISQAGAAVFVPIAIGWTGIAVGQTNPRVPRTNPVIPGAPLPPPEPANPANPLLDLPAQYAPQLPELPPSKTSTIRVVRFVFLGHTVFSTQELEAIVAPYIEKDVTLGELLSARSAITQYYTDRGYKTSGAYIPVALNQGIRRQSAVITIQIIEGQLENINVEGSDRLGDYVRSRIPSGIVNENRLLEALRLLDADPLIQNISASLTPGSQPGLSQLNVFVKAKKPLSVTASADNYRSPASGTFERGLELEQRHLLGLGDSLQVAYKNTDGSNGIAASYSIPINPQNGTVRLSYAELHNNIIEEPFNELDILSRQRSYELSFRQPIVRQATENSTSEFAVGLSLSRLETSSELLGLNFPISPGADDEGKTRISAIGFFQDFRSETSRQILAARSELSVGLRAFGATINSEPPDSRFVLWRGQVGYLRKLGDTNLLLRGNIQLADRPLVPLEQFGLGGQGTVRGYRQDLLIADNGVSASAELYVPLFDGDSGKLQVVPFVDLGTTWNNDRDIEGDTSTLASLGLGLQYNLGSSFTVRLDYGLPLVNVDSSKNTWQENGFTFSVRYQPF